MSAEMLYDDELDDLNFYSRDVIERLLEEDELSAREAGFMRGYQEGN